MAIEAHYVDASAVLGVLFRREGESAFDDPAAIIVSSDLTTVEVALELRRRELSRLNDERELSQLKKEAARVLALVKLFPVSDEVLDRARDPYPFAVGLRTALHVATAQVVALEVPHVSFWTWLDTDAAAAGTRGLATRGLRAKTS